jgi:ankyrin repeat protein
MSPTSLPDRPSLEHLKKQARSLLRAAQAGEPAALQRFAALPALAKTPLAGSAGERLALHDAQSVVAREHGFPSWNALRDEVEARTLSFESAVDAFVRAATGGAEGRARRLLELHPAIRSASLQAALVLGDVAAVEETLRADPALATASGGAQQWKPLLYVCHTCLDATDPARDADLVTIARRLCALGASPDAEYHWHWHPELPRTVLWAALCGVRRLLLAEALLEAGANPSDGVSLHIAGGTGDLEAVELLHRFGVDVNGRPGGPPPLVYMLSWATDPAGPRWLLAHGADANRSWGPDAEAPLHVAARRWDVAMVELLVGHGADPTRRRGDGRTPHTLAALHGNHDAASWLLAHGAQDELSPVERFVAACSRGDAAGADAILRAHPASRAGLSPGHHRLLDRPAEQGDAAALETMLARGFDPRVPDRDGVTPLHRAAMAGHPAAVRVLLAFGAPVEACDGMFAATPLVWAAEGLGHAQPGTDHVEAARLLLAAGSPPDWTPPQGAPHSERTLDALMELRRAAKRDGRP